VILPIKVIINLYAKKFKCTASSAAKFFVYIFLSPKLFTSVT